MQTEELIIILLIMGSAILMGFILSYTFHVELKKFFAKLKNFWIDITTKPVEW